MSQKIAFVFEDELCPPEVLKMVEQRSTAGFELEFVGSQATPEERMAAVSSADFVIGYPGDLSAEELEAAASLKLLQILSAGYEYLDLDSYRSRNIPVANNGGANAPTVAEHAIMLILSVFKKLPLHHNAMVNREWLGAEETLRMRELRGKTLGIIGFGRIGQETARIARGFQTKTLYHDMIAAPQSVEQELAAKHVPLDTLLRESDVITIHTALTESSQGLINAERIALMKPSAILVNTSRGPVVDEPALIDALREGKIYGAGLDVFINEPLETDSPLLSLPNVVVTPHIAGVTLDTWSRRIEFGFSNVERVAAGEAPQSVIS